MARPAMSIPALAAPAWIAHPMVGRQRLTTTGASMSRLRRREEAERPGIGSGEIETMTLPLADNRDERAELDRPFSTDLVGCVTCQERADWGEMGSAQSTSNSNSLVPHEVGVGAEGLDVREREVWLGEGGEQGGRVTEWCR